MLLFPSKPDPKTCDRRIDPPLDVLKICDGGLEVLHLSLFIYMKFFPADFDLDLDLDYVADLDLDKRILFLRKRFDVFLFGICVIQSIYAGIFFLLLSVTTPPLNTFLRLSAYIFIV
jgi:hypothetical protein